MSLVAARVCRKGKAVDRQSLPVCLLRGKIPDGVSRTCTGPRILEDSQVRPKTMSPFLQSPAAVGAAIAIGNFDGVHRGHAAMLQRLKALAKQAGGPAVAVTFEPHPVTLLRPEKAPPLLTGIDERIRLLKACGADQVAVLQVSPELLKMSADEFFTKVIVQEFSAAAILEGPNFRFGKDRLGDVALLQELATRNFLLCEIMSPVNDGDQMISSSRIRRLIGDRSLQQAVEMLGHPYRIQGTVVSGAKRGRTIGFPTANLSQVTNLIPADGVYAGVCSIEGRCFPAAVSIGPNPTFAEDEKKIECHLSGYQGDLYGRRLAVDLLTELRPLKTFSGVDELIAAITADTAESCRVAQVHAGIEAS